MSDDVVIRDAVDADVEAMLAVSLAADAAELGEPNTVAGDIRGLLAGATARVVVAADPDDDDGVVGWAWADYVAGHSRAAGMHTVRPDDTAAQASPVLFDWVRRTAAALAPGVPVRTFTGSTNTAKRELFEAAGGRLVRHFFRMVIDLDTDTDTDTDLGTAGVIGQPDLGPDVAVRHGEDTEADRRTMYTVVETAFADHFGHEPEPYEVWCEYATALLGDRSLWWLATVDGEPAAALMAFPLTARTGFVDTLGTLRPYRGRGIGRSLLLTAFAELRRRGMSRAVLGVDAESPTGALRLYESVGMRAEHDGLQYLLPPLPV